MNEMRQRGAIQRRQRAATIGPAPAVRRARRGPAPTVGDTRPRRRTEQAPPDAPESRVCCRACGSPVTSEEHMVPVDGQTLHHRTNPAGVAFTFGCFSAAPGAEPVGEATSRHSWFFGHTWRLAHCRACGAHLGWQFEGVGSGFFGLILDRLTTGAGTAGEGT